jgi:hypothetical protein
MFSTLKHFVEWYIIEALGVGSSYEGRIDAVVDGRNQQGTRVNSDS